MHDISRLGMHDNKLDCSKNMDEVWNSHFTIQGHEPFKKFTEKKESAVVGIGLGIWCISFFSNYLKPNPPKWSAPDTAAYFGIPKVYFKLLKIPVNVVGKLNICSASSYIEKPPYSCELSEQAPLGERKKLFEYTRYRVKTFAKRCHVSNTIYNLSESIVTVATVMFQDGRKTAIFLFIAQTSSVNTHFF